MKKVKIAVRHRRRPLRRLPLRQLPYALGFVLFAVGALLFCALAILGLAALGYRPNPWLCALAVLAVEAVLFGVALQGQGPGRSFLPPQQSKCTTAEKR